MAQGMVTSQVTDFVLFRYTWKSGDSAGVQYKAGEIKDKVAPVDDASGRTSTRLATGKVRVQMSLAPLKFFNGKGNPAYIYCNHTIAKKELQKLTSDHPKIITTFGSGKALPLGLEVLLGGAPSQEQLSRRRKLTKC
jgi:hypothetical protein